MPSKVKLKRSYTTGAVPTSSDLDTNECCINWADGKLFVKNNTGNIVSIRLGGSAVVEATTAAGFPATGSAGTLYHATSSSRIYFWDSSGFYVEAGTSGGGGSGGDGADSTLRALFTPPAPTSATATAGNAQATVSWTAPTVLAQTPITDYTLQYSSNSGSSWTTFTRSASTTTSATVTGLTNGTAYTFRVAGVNGVGTGAYSAASASVTPAAGTPPGAPTGLTATGGNAQISLAWTAPASVGSSAITGYALEYTPSGGSAQTVATGSTSTSYTITGLTNGTAYTARVAAVNAAGTGSYTAASSSVTPAASTSKLTVTRGSGGASTFTGLGTAASPYTRSARVMNNNADGIMQGFGGLYTFTATASGTAYVTCTFYDDINNQNSGSIRKNGTTQGSYIGDGATATARSFTVASGDVITFWGESTLTSFANVSVWVV